MWAEGWHPYPRTSLCSVPMPARPPGFTVLREPLYEEALEYLPERDLSEGELRIYAVHLEQVDAAIGTTLRTTIEHFGRYVRMPVLLTTPEDPDVWLKLAHALGYGLPTTVGLGTGAEWPTEPAPQTILLPARPIVSGAGAEQLGEDIFEKLEGNYGKRVARYLGPVATMLAEASLWSCRDSSVGVVAGMSYERRDDVLRLILANTESAISSRDRAEEALIDLMDESERRNGALNAIASMAKGRGFEIKATIAAGNGRLRWEGAWAASTEEYVAGMSVIIDVSSN